MFIPLSCLSIRELEQKAAKDPVRACMFQLPVRFARVLWSPIVLVVASEIRSAFRLNWGGLFSHGSAVRTRVI
jgi:hypothetical protein